MSICEDAPASAAAGNDSFLSRLAATSVVDRVAAVFTSWRNRRLVVSMRDFDDAQLADIGLNRHDVEKALRNTSVDPTVHLVQARQNSLKGVRHS